MRPRPPANTPPGTDRPAQEIGPSFLGRAGRRGNREGIFQGLVGTGALASVLLLVAIIAVVTVRAWPAYRQFGLRFLWTRQWNPVTENFGALPLVYGTLITSLFALLVATPLGLSIAMFLSENILPLKVRDLLGFVVELLAAIPSVIYGLWGLAVVIPLTTQVGRWLFLHFHGFPLFSTPPVGPGILPASLVLAIMVLPTIAAVSRSSLRNVPASLKEGAYALGAARWDVILHFTVPSAWTGIFGAVVLAFGRALGETMALAMLVGNNNSISPSLLAPANTIASLLANSFGEASGIELSALMYLSFILMTITLVINLVAQALLGRSREPSASA
jgi:phosphate transport system permease protein